ncbi:serine/threonine protein kinase [Leptolyngbya sp. BL0902]|uniref:adenylate/guanylate cyclase domain-containing protein n=1 Tax=Leptolyngbya sp. BL0902 TaxID=1115757 RepID=UPI0018E6FFBC|nr:adenylate/guanylate cyclase domain-containing protein [Leptolyngbya sp. BL0902]QQE64209.1 serine/threonine protein kinase [Leptolyngbya sp. BL0902]
MAIPGYETHQVLHCSDVSIVERGLWDGRRVVVKRLNRPYPLPQDLDRYRQEHDLLSRLDSDWIIKSYALMTEHHTLALVLEDMGGDSLRQHYPAQPLDLDTFLTLALAITQGLGDLHRANIIHKDINPANIIFNPQTGQLRLIDFGLSSQVQQEITLLQHPNTLEGTLAYISPEQTGRVNRLIDYRSDIYSLGVTFYELLTGSLPFNSTDPMTLVHGHLAKTPPNLADQRPDLPAALVALVSKMMAKGAEDRYQSAWGIQADLERLQRKIPDFAIAQDDYPVQFRLPQRLYGREADLKRLLAGFEAMRQGGHGPFVLVTGYAGIGKSALVGELHRPVTEAQGYFAAGKFEQFQRVTPYSAWIKALGELLRQVLAESTERLDHLRAQLLDALGHNGQVLIEVIPDLGLILGPQPPVPTLAPAEAQNRFENLFQRFVRVFAQPDHPLVLFLDDWQWADSASLRLLRLVLGDSQCQSLLLIGSYRSNEVGPTHPLMRLLTTLAQEGLVPTTLDLQPLGLGHIRQLLQDALASDGPTVQPLAELVLAKTNGNPFFVNEFIKTLATDGLLQFDPSQRGWRWDLAQIQAQDITDNVVVLMTDKLKKLSAAVQYLLSIAACIGTTFEVETLSLVADQDREVVQVELSQATQAGLILTTKQSQELRFLHDRVQQAAYELVSPDEKAALHLRIGQQGRGQLTNHPEKLFDVVDHLNLGRSQLPESEHLDVAELNLEAGRRAKQATAYRAAAQYLEAGIRLCPACDTPAELRFALHREQAEVQYLLGELAASQQAIDELLRQELSPLQRADVFNVLIVQNTIQTNYQQALAAGQEALAALGITLPLTDLDQAFAEEYAKLQAALGDRPLASLEHLPAMTNAEQRFAVELLSNLGSAAYRYDRKIWQIIVVMSINLFLRHGNGPQSCYGYSNYGTLLGSVLGDYPAGYESALVSLGLAERYGNRTQVSRACFILSNFVQSWVRPVAEADAINQAGVDAGLETGEFQYVGYTLSYRISNLFFQSRPLAEVLTALQEAMAFCRQVNNQWAIDALLGYQITLAQLQPDSAADALPTATDYIETCRRHNSLSGLCRYHILQGLVQYLDHQFAAALDHLDQAAPLLDFILGVVSVAEYHFYTALVLAALPPTADHQQRLDQHRTWLHDRAKTCVANFLQKAQLIDAECAHINQQPWEAIHHYDAAIASAVAHGFLADEAIACERAARFWLSHHKPTLAQPYLRQAHYAFTRWGATHKVQHLEQEFPELAGVRSESTHRTLASQGSGSRLGETLDLSSLLKASQAISSQIVLGTLTRDLMDILVENAGAQLGYLLLQGEDQLTVQAYSGPEDRPIATEANDPTQLPLSLLNYVRRTQTPVLLADAVNGGDFTQDPYLRAQKPQSVLCVPLLHQGDFIGLVYFEHHLTTNAFTLKQLEIINVLSSQAAISIQNAQLYNTLEQKVAQRTEALAAERAKSERLLRNILPASIVERLKENERDIADRFDEVTVMFCDIVQFTSLSSQIPPSRLVQFLNQVFSEFDHLCEVHQLEKIKTIGDAYVAVGGLPGSATNHVEAIANMALDMLKIIQSVSLPIAELSHQSPNLRIGIHVGPVVAGVIGKRKFAYDLWGDTVNVASRMESHGEAGKIQVTEAIYRKLAHHYRFERRAPIEVKGKGKMTTYWLLGHP